MAKEKASCGSGKVSRCGSKAKPAADAKPATEAPKPVAKPKAKSPRPRG